MDQELRKLLRLQDLDLQVIGLNEEKTSSVAELKEVNADFQRALSKVQDGKENFKQLQLAIKKIEIELEVNLDRIGKLESQQSLVKTNQEYKALDKEIIDTRAQIALVEEKLLGKMEESELLVAQNKELARKVEEQKNLVTEKEQRINRRIDDLNRRIEELNGQRKALVEGADKRLVRVYNRIFKNKKGAALVPIINQTCQGCHLTVPPNVESQARRQEQLIICENCARILYIPEEPPPTDENQPPDPG